MTRIKTFEISIPTDADGFVGRACNATDCKQYFKVYVPDHKDQLHCPYCGIRFSRNELFTSSQLKYAEEVLKEEARIYAIEEMQKMMSKAFRGSKFIKYKPGPKPHKKLVSPNYAEREVDTELKCSECSIRFQVYGIFGYCPGCSCENLQIYDTNWSIIKQKLNSEEDKKRQLRHAYSDLVSAFEVFCSRKAKRLTEETCNFQVLFDARKFFKKHAKVDILKNINESNLLTLRRVFQKRHVCIHSGGTINDRYVKMIPEDFNLLGTQVLLTVEELETAAIEIRVSLGDLVKAIESPG